MNSYYQRRPARKTKLSVAAQRVISELDDAFAIFFSEVARGLRRMGFRGAADFLSPVGGNQVRT